SNIDSNVDNANDRLISDCLDQLQQQFLTTKDNAIAIGECGLDKVFAKKHAHDNHYQQQQAVFEIHCEVAKQSGKAMIIHNIKSQAEILHQVKRLQLDSDNIGVVHAFSGSYEQAKAWLDAGFYLGIGGTITYPRAQKTRATLKKLPLDRLLLETDAPAMPVFGKQGQANTPLAISQIANTAASLLSVDQDKLASQLWQNFFRLFQLEPC
ncbi:MAG: TatD family hydrolase, partial [Pseudomonadales bacterium]|nr:TatD family hydrolase [Pseudomonadales bacterium]